MVNVFKELEEERKDFKTKSPTSILEYKENFYKNLIKNKLKDTWNPMNSVTPNDKVG